MAVAISWVTASALDLPVTTINGSSYHYYEVKKGDTLFSLSRALGLTKEEIISNNPSVADGLRTGTTLYFPVSQGSTTISHEVKKGETLFGLSHKYGVTPDDIIALNPQANNGIRAGETLLIPTTSASAAASDKPRAEADTTEPQEKPAKSHENQAGQASQENTVANNDRPASDPDAEQAEPATIAVILPFMLSEDTPTKASRRYLDFYKGLLIAADSLGNRGRQIKIAAFDSEGSLDRVKSILEDVNVKNASVIIAPEDDAQLSAIMASADKNESYVINNFNFRDSAYMNNPYAWQSNIPHRQMYEKAAEAMMAEHESAIPVLLSNSKGGNEKAEFVSFVKDAYLSKGITPVEIAYDGSLHQSDLEALSDDASYVLLPSSGSVGEFNKFCYVLKSYRESLQDPSKVRLFGYPDWTAFLGDAADMLHTLEATVYTRFYDDRTSLGHRNVTDAFQRNYGTAPVEVIPNHALLGFDLGTYIIKNIRSNDGEFNPDYPSTYRGVQSSFTMTPYQRADSDSDAGYYNSALYIVRYLQGKYVTTSVM